MNYKVSNLGKIVVKVWQFVLLRNKVLQQIGSINMAAT